MSNKQSKKLRKEIRKQLKEGLSENNYNAVVKQCQDLELQLQQKQKEVDALYEVITEMRKEMQEDAKKEYENIPEVLK